MSVQPGQPYHALDGDPAGSYPGPVAAAIYLDYNATTPIDPRVVSAMAPYLGAHFANPSSTYRLADAPTAALRQARAQVADLIGATADEIVFTASGSEADALAILGITRAALLSGASRPHVITQATEHPAVLGACAQLQRLHGVDVTYLPVDASGMVDPGDLAAAMTARTVLVSITHANNETGVIQSIADLAAITHQHRALFHTDAAQSAGKIPIDIQGLGADLLTVVGHKIYAPKGIAALYIREGLTLEPLVPGGGQERGRRAGTENVALAVALGCAADLAAVDLADGYPQRVKELRDRLHQGLSQQLPGGVDLNGHPDARLPNTLNISITGHDAAEILAAAPGLAASTGSACHSARTTPSPVLGAMGADGARARAAIRVSLGRWSTTADIDTAIEALVSAASRTPTHAIPAATR